MVEPEERTPEAAPQTGRKRLRLFNAPIIEIGEEAKAASRRYWRRDVPICALIAMPILLAFDQSMRFGLTHGWIPVNVFTAFILRPTLDYLAARSLVKWLRIDFRQLGLPIATFAGLDWISFKTDPAITALVVCSTAMVLLMADVLLDPSYRLLERKGTTDH